MSNLFDKFLHLVFRVLFTLQNIAFPSDDFNSAKRVHSLFIFTLSLSCHCDVLTCVVVADDAVRRRGGSRYCAMDSRGRGAAQRNVAPVQ